MIAAVKADKAKAHAKQKAEEARDPQVKHDFVEAARSWRHLAEQADPLDR